MSEGITILQRAACAALFLCGAGAHAQLGAPEIATERVEREAVVAKRHMVAAADPRAVEAGLEILRAGGSAADAAIAVQLVLGLVEPQSSGLGGGAFVLHWSDQERRVRSYDARETAPAAARPERFLDRHGNSEQFMAAVTSGRSVGVPGVPRLLETLHRKHGRLPWARLFEPAIRLADQGFIKTRRLARTLERFPGVQALFPLNREYAATLRTLAAQGADAFYRGEIAADIVRAARSDLTLEDLAAYRVIEREPLCGSYRGHRLCGMAPPSSGALGVLQILGILERTNFHRAAPGSVEAVHLFSEAARLAYADRARYVGDPDFTPVPVMKLLDPKYLDARAKRIGERSMGFAMPGTLDPETPGTSHFSVVDAQGNAVAMTSSIEMAFGSRIQVRGFLLNNQLTDFSFNPEFLLRPAVNRVEGGKRPRSSMSPTLVFDRDGRLQLTLGSPGGLAIINFVAKTLVASLDWRLDIQQAISAPNFGSTNGPTFLERGTAIEALGDALAERGHVLNFARLTSGLHGIERISGGWRGGADPRRAGIASGD
ncbi:MAG TPA: gamma-glutamyltransferase family protein [Burkholderiales bacterium]|nr:gamma-glutamyltransferase family protein [Burkholderiales bacterium]